jgi:cellulose synthase/poly-beta-1,6-N-acetylglucosamine synthase-like glycosyltransferase
MIGVGLAYGLIALSLAWGAFRNRAPLFSACPSVTVLVAARSVASQIDACLGALGRQNYDGKLAVIVINDRSEDDTGSRAEGWTDQITGLTVLNVEQTYHLCPKKNALEHGVRASVGEIILTTDADCHPPPEWVAHTVSRFGDRVGAVAGPAPLVGHGWLGRLLAFQSLIVGAIGVGSAGIGHALTCSGRNFAFRRAAFHDVGGYDPSGHFVGGDDVYLMRAIADHPDWRVVYHSDPDATVPSPAHSGHLWRRHLRYQSKTIRLGFGTLMAALPVYILHLLLLAGPVLCWWRPDLLPNLLGLAAVKLLTDGVFLFLAARRLQQTHQLLWLPLIEIVAVPYVSIVSAVGALRPTTWV